MQREAPGGLAGLNLWRTNLRRRVVATWMTASPAARRASAAARRASRRRAALARVNVPSMPAPSCRTSSAAAAAVHPRRGPPHTSAVSRRIASSSTHRTGHRERFADAHREMQPQRVAACSAAHRHAGSTNARSRHPPCRLDAPAAGVGADEQPRRTRVRCAVLGMSTRMRAGCQPCWRPAHASGRAMRVHRQKSEVPEFGRAPSEQLAVDEEAVLDRASPAPTATARP